MTLPPLKAVLVGCGGISGQWFDALKSGPDVVLTGLVDLNEASALKRKEEFKLGQARVGRDLSSMLATQKPDVVFDCTVPPARAGVVEGALRQGCHVLSEKPMANSLAEARHLRDVARECGRTYAIMQNRRYLRSIRSLRTFLSGGAVGSLTTLNSDFYIGAHFGGFRDAMKHVLLLDMAIHTFDQARFISGVDPVAVFCHEWNPQGSWYAHGASAAAIFEMSNGLVVTYRGSWCAEGDGTTWEADWRALGTSGQVLWDGANGLRAQHVPQREKARQDVFVHTMKSIEVPLVEWPGPEAHAGCIHHFLDSIRGGRVPETDCTDNIKSLAMTFGAIESAETGRRVMIET